MGFPRPKLEGHVSTVSPMELSLTGITIASAAHEDGNARIWDTMRVDLLYQLGGFALTSAAITFWPNGRMIACQSQDLAIEGIHEEFMRVVMGWICLIKGRTETGPLPPPGSLTNYDRSYTNKGVLSNAICQSQQGSHSLVVQ